jgi:hypothetical protein
VINRKEHSDKTPAKQGAAAVIPEPNKITASTAYDFEAKNLTAYGGLLPVATMLEKLGCQQLVEETLTVKRATRTMPMYQFILIVGLRSFRCHANSIRTGSQSADSQVPLISENSIISSAPCIAARIVASVRDSSTASTALPSEYLIVIFSSSSLNHSSPFLQLAQVLEVPGLVDTDVRGLKKPAPR